MTDVLRARFAAMFTKAQGKAKKVLGAAIEFNPYSVPYSRQVRAVGRSGGSTKGTPTVTGYRGRRP